MHKQNNSIKNIFALKQKYFVNFAILKFLEKKLMRILKLVVRKNVISATKVFT